MVNAELDTIAKKLDTIIKLVALDVVAGRKLGDQCNMLSAAGLTTKEIANILGKNSHLVSQTLYAARKLANGAKGRDTREGIAVTTEPRQLSSGDSE